ncbi:MAG: hypothetical protein ACE366_06980 [Bradymonadia bacterium]
MDAKWILAAALWPLLPACDQGATARTCDPRRTDECEAEQFCTVDGDGVPYCADLPDAGVDGDRGDPAGTACTDSSTCREGQGCIELYGVSRCLPFCTPGDADDSQCTVCEGVGDLEVCRGGGSCQAVLPDRPDIGACVLPCQPLSETAQLPFEICPAASRCDFIPEVSPATCVAPQTPAVQVDQPCGLVGACEEGLWCTPVPADLRPEGVESVALCLPAVDAAGACEEKRTAITLSTDTYTPLSVCILE